MLGHWLLSGELLYVPTELKHLTIVLFADDLRLQVVTIATEKTDGYHRFMRSSRLFDLNVEVINLALFPGLHPRLVQVTVTTWEKWSLRTGCYS